jgi:alkaline phosphatase
MGTMIKRTLCTALAGMIFAITAFAQAKNVILFIGDGAGVSSLNAASIYGYGKPQALYMQRMPHLALADTSSAREWVTDGSAGATAWATGVKTRNRVVSMFAAAEADVRDGETYKTVFEYAQENGLSTGVISNDHPGAVAGLVAPFYAHHNNVTIGATFTCN